MSANFTVGDKENSMSCVARRRHKLLVNEDNDCNVSLNRRKRKLDWDRTGRSDWTEPNGRECAKITSGVVDLPSAFSYASLASLPHDMDNSEDQDNSAVLEVSAESDNCLISYQAQAFSYEEFIPSSVVVSGQTTFDVITKLKQYFTCFYELSSFPRHLQREDTSLPLATEEELRGIKSSYNTYVPEVVSGKIDCKC